MARNLDTSGTSEFQEFVGKFGKNYSTTEQLNTRMQVWLDNREIVKGLNEANAGTGLTFSMNNSMSDLTRDEFNKRLGLKNSLDPEAGKTNGSTSSIGSGMLGGRHLQDDLSINWVDQDRVHPVKDQLECGSCWAFAATTTQESMQAIKDNKPAVRLSEQEGVDCDKES